MNTTGAQLFQSRPDNTTDAIVYPAVSLVTEFTRIFVCNNTANPVTFRLYHDDDGSTMSLDTALFYDKSIAANDTLEIVGHMNMSGIQVGEKGTIGIQSGTADALTFTGYGYTWQGR